MNLKNLFITTLLVSACAFVFTSCSKDKDKDKNGKSRITVNVNENVAINLVKVDGGEFVMGATAEQESYAEGTEKPAHSVKVKTFYMAETEVTQELWKAVFGTNPSSHKGDQYPVENISWQSAKNFVQKLNVLTGKKFRLPTEAEWEYAARGGKKSKGYIWSGSNDADEVAWTSDNSTTTQAVGSKLPNELGLYDMSGNVYEYCNDIYQEDWYLFSPKDNPQGPNYTDVVNPKLKCVRGGSFFSGPERSRVSFRFSRSEDQNTFINGMRLAMDPD